LKRTPAMPVHGLPTPPAPWHVSHISTDGSTASSHLRTQTSASTPPAVRCLLAIGHGHDLPAMPATPSSRQANGGLLMPMGGCARGDHHRHWSRCALRRQAPITQPRIVECQPTRHAYCTSSTFVNLSWSTQRTESNVHDG
jgi:hypothetical protein